MRYRKFVGVQCLVWALSGLMWFGVSMLDVNTDESTPVEIAWWACVVFEILIFYVIGKLDLTSPQHWLLHPFYRESLRTMGRFMLED